LWGLGAKFKLAFFSAYLLHEQKRVSVANLKKLREVSAPENLSPKLEMQPSHMKSFNTFLVFQAVVPRSMPEIFCPM